MTPWRDYSGRLSPLKLIVFLALFAPALWVAVSYSMGMLGARALTEAIHQIGLWTLRFLFLALAITPLRDILRWPNLMLVRRMLGVAAFAYVMIHLVLYAADEAFDLVKVASEIVLRIYLTIGFVALLGLAVLAATSTDAMVRRLGRGWYKLHRIAYVIAALSCIHFFMQSKLQQWEPTVMAGLFLWLIGYRLLAWRFAKRGHLAIGWVFGLGIATGLLTALGEVGWFWFKLNVEPIRVLSVNWTFVTGVRPAPVVLAIGLGIALLGAIRWFRQSQGRRVARAAS